VTVVLDNSVAVEWLTGGPLAERADQIIRTSFETLWAPALFWSGLAYVLGKRINRRLMTPAFRDTCLRQMIGIGVQTDIACAEPGLSLDRAIRLGDDHGLTIYDAVYLELAIRRGGAVATFDNALAVAARAAGVEVLTT
jgi:predicted nucleic acid-binding protein